MSTLRPATRVQFREGASNRVDTPFLQATGFEHEHEHEHRAPNAERRTPNAKREARSAKRLTRTIHAAPDNLSSVIPAALTPQEAIPAIDPDRSLNLCPPEPERN